jgi:hypothetical protein
MAIKLAGRARAYRYTARADAQPLYEVRYVALGELSK